jgi:hypothetical protein
MFQKYNHFLGLPCTFSILSLKLVFVCPFSELYRILFLIEEGLVLADVVVRQGLGHM